MIKSLCTLILISLCSTLAAGTIDLAGKWEFQLDRQDEGIAGRWWDKQLDDTIGLPTTTARAAKGDPLTLQPTLDKASLVHLHQKFSYVGPAWYRRSVEIPAGWQDKDVELSLERVIWETRVWVNGEPMGMRDSLTTPHRYEISRALKPGKNEIVIRVDNRKKLEIGVGHAYTDETQTIWNGVVGKLKLEARDRVRIKHLQLRPNLARGGVEVTIATHNGGSRDVTAELLLQAEAQNFSGKSPAPVKQTVTIKPGDADQTVFYPMGNEVERWSEFNPKLYVMKVTLAGAGSHSELTSTFGMKEFKANGRHFTINGQRTFLRGTLECCIFPETAHPAMDDAKWEKIFSTVKDYGLNFVRFHSWCPPEAAFRVADRVGVYLQIELPNWSFKMGQVPDVDEFFRKEGERMIREYANHPSWCLFSMGNELVGDFSKVDELVAHLQQLDPALLYTSTSYSFERGGAPRGLLPGPNDDYFISQQTKSGWVRGQGFLNNTKPNTVSDYAEGLACLSIPLVSHEVGQYNVYPNLAELPKYNAGPLRALGYEAIKADLEKKGRLAEAPEYTRDSGKLAALLYKEDIERALRTKDQAGIALLDLHDFPGQSTATVGLLDSFWDSKGLITPKEFRRFCGPTVPLVRMAKMVFQNDETFEAGVEMAHFGPAPITNATVNWKLRDGRKVVGEGEFKTPLIPLGNGIQLGRIRQSLSSVTQAAKLKLSVELDGTAIGNDWSIWVYPATKALKASDVAIVENFDSRLFQPLREGRSVVLLPARTSLKSPLDGRFIPVFWSPLHFPNQPGTLGAMIDPSHPVWAEFPTDSHTDWQWWELLSRSFAVDLDSLSPKPTMPFRFVDKYNRNALPAAIFEVKVGKGRLLVCTLDIVNDLDTRIAARQLRRSILSYAASDRFNPKVEWSEETLKSLASTTRYLVKASSANAGYPAELAVDGDPKTFWHTDWEGDGPGLPAEFTLDLRHETTLRGFTYLPRQDMERGHIGSYEVATSVDGKNWATAQRDGSFPNTTKKQTVKFDQPIKARYLRLIARTDLGNSGNAAIAEITPLTDDSTADVRNLGIVPGLNDSK